MSGISMGFTVAACKLVWPQVRQARERVANELRGSITYDDVVKETTAFFGLIEQAAHDPHFRQPDVLIKLSMPERGGDEPLIRDRVCAMVLRHSAIRALRSFTDSATNEALRAAVIMLDSFIDTPAVERLAALAP